eukprot:scaffold26275_cov31-Tisochrysis_lutea.AAC.5
MRSIFESSTLAWSDSNRHASKKLGRELASPLLQDDADIEGARWVPGRRKDVGAGSGRPNVDVTASLWCPGAISQPLNAGSG